MNKLKIRMALWLGTLFAFTDRLFRSRSAVPLPNTLGLLNENGIESLFVDPASVNLPFSARYLLIKRGASGYQYGDICNGGAGGPLPLGPTADSPYAVGDIMMVRRLGGRPGLELGISVAATAVTIDHLLVSAAGGCVQDATTVVGNGTYWCVGRAAATMAANSSTMEVPYVPMDPFQLVLTGTTWSYPTSVS